MDTNYCNLLTQQIKRHFGSIENLLVELQWIMLDINNTYNCFDNDVKLPQNSIEISSLELRDAFRKQKLDGEVQKEIIHKIKTAILKILCDNLKGEGYKVRPVPNGPLALRAAEKESPDLMLLDIMLPDIDGYKVCRLLKENKNLCSRPIIFIRALNDTNDIVKTLTSGDPNTLPIHSKPRK